MRVERHPSAAEGPLRATGEPLTPARPRKGRTSVLHVVWALEGGGLERLVHELAKGLDPDEFELHVLSLGPLGSFARGLESHASVWQAPPMSPLSLLAPLALTREIRSIGPTIVHSHSGVWYKTSKAARWAGVPRVVHTDHGRTPEPRFDLLWERWAAKRTDAIVVVSEWLGRFCTERLGVAPAKIRHLHNGIDVDRFRGRADSDFRPAAVPPDRAVIGSVGRLDPIKGYDVVIEALAHLRRLPAGDVAPHLLIVGDGPEREALQARIDRLGLSASVTITGWVDEVEEVVRWFDVFTLGSRSEGTSLSLLEAMSSEVCPVVTDVGGNAAVLGQDLAHRLVPPEDPLALAAGWSRALTDGNARLRDGRAGRARVVREFSLAGMLRGHEALYRELVRGKRA